MRFGVMTMSDLTWEELAARFAHAEEAGIETAWTVDHLASPDGRDGPWLEGWATLAALAERTRRIRLGCLVLAMTFRNAAVVARQASAIDHISGGRLELGLGGGGSRRDHELTGIPVLTPKERATAFAGWVARVDELLTTLDPLPLQRPRPPVTVGGSGPTYLRVAADRAARWNTYGRRGMSAAEAMRAAREANHRLDELCAARGRDPSTLVRSQLLGNPRFVDERPFASRDAFDDVVGRWAEAGMTELVFYWPAAEDREVFDRVLR